jgi:hypothetical protein
MDPIVSLFAKKYLASLIARGVQALGVYLVVHAKLEPTDVNSVLGNIDAQQIVGWLFTVGPEVFHAIQNKGHATAVVANNATTPAKPTPQHGATGLTVLILSLGLLSASGQTLTPTNAPGGLSTNLGVTLPVLGVNVTTNEAAVANDVISWFSPYISALTNVTGLHLDADAVYTSGGHWGGIAQLSLDLSQNTNVVIAPGFSAGYVGESWYVGAANLSLGWHFNISKQPFYIFTDNGVSARYSDAALGEQNITGIATAINFGKGWGLVFDVAKVSESQSGSKSGYAGGVRLSAPWPL